METDLDLLALYEQASQWTATKVDGAATELDTPSINPGWNVRTLMNHMLETQKYFVDAAEGRDASPPSPTPPDLVSDDPVADFCQVRAETLSTFEQPGVIEKTGISLGIAASDQLLHGWDLATSTGQDAAMPEGLPDAVYGIIHGRFTDEERVGIFAPELTVPPNSSAQDKLLAYTGRDPATTI